jgi:hypothetical protein
MSHPGRRADPRQLPASEDPQRYWPVPTVAAYAGRPPEGVGVDAPLAVLRAIAPEPVQLQDDPRSAAPVA